MPITRCFAACARAAACAACPLLLHAQTRAGADSAHHPRPLRDTLPAVRISADRPFAAGPLEQITPRALTVGKRTDRLVPDAVPATLALNTTRQAFARAPGVMVWEQDAGGLQAGLAIRGLSPNRSWEFNTRQDGADIAADIAGYPEAYYTPPFEGVERIELVRGAAALQFGAQFGGLLNYVMKGPPVGHRLAGETTQRAGSNGLYTTYTALGGNNGRLGWHAALNLRQGDGWRPHSGFGQQTLLLRATWHHSPTTRLSASLAGMRYELEQGGGLTDQQFAAAPRQARRSRDWFAAPWLVPTLTLEHWLGESTALTVTAFGLDGQRNSVGAIVAPTIADVASAPRRVDRDRYLNAGSETRLVHAFTLGGRSAALAAGTRLTWGRTDRWRARGTTADDADFTTTAPRTLDLRFTTTTAAAFTEITLPIADGVAVVPGVRLEQLHMRGNGTVAPARATFEPAGAAVPFDQRRTRTTPLAALGLSVTRWASVEVYGNVSQAFRPATFAELFPNDLVAVDPALRHATGVSSDMGLRGTLGRRLTFDVGAFHLTYRDRAGVLSRSALGADSLRFPNGLRTNVGDSRHQGVEAFAEVALLDRPNGLRTTLFGSGAYIDARYVRGPQRGRQVEYAPRWQGRSGLTVEQRDRFAIAVQASYVDPVFADANNAPTSPTGVTGRIPSYLVTDLNARARLWRTVWADIGLNNALDRRYFTRRAGGYPGPGLIPAEPRTLLMGLRVAFTGDRLTPDEARLRAPTLRRARN